MKQRMPGIHLSAASLYDPKHKPRNRKGLRGHHAIAVACLIALCGWIVVRRPPFFGLTRRQPDTTVRPWGSSGYVFRHVCLAMNAFDEDQGSDNSQRTLVWFNHSDAYAKRCVSCNNPVMTHTWNSIPDYVTDLSPGWHAEGGLLRDAARPCGMMWDNVLVARDVEDAHTCRARHGQEIADRGQVVGMGRTVRRPRAAVLQWYRGNPGHQLLDSLLSQLDLFRTYDGPFESHQACDPKEWYCAIVRMLGVTVTPVPPDALVCYGEAVVPRLGLYGRGDAVLPDATWRWLRVRVGAATSLAPTPHVLLYAHNSTGRRVWTNVEEHVALLRRRGTSVEVVVDFASHSVAAQAHMFRRATHVIMPHGGQWANIIFSAPGTRMWELSCSGYSHIAQGLPMATWDHRTVRLVDHGGCADDGLDTNFTVPLAMMTKNGLGVTLPTNSQKSSPDHSDGDSDGEKEKTL